MESRANGFEESKEASYAIISFKGPELPEQYYNMILSKWLRTLKDGSDFFKLIDRSSYFEAYQSFIKTILARSNTVVRMAVLSDDKDVVLGWSACEGPALHYVWVHCDQRNQGIGTSLVPKGIEIITHATNTGIRFWQKRLPTAKLNPFY